ncbi:MAG: hypothetical protein K1Y02_22420 [Candidatus Hydrogenedentes bacterium]|nr:hypothetical protein [Candidatus Hydrogenedentota bacterium]
MPGETVEPVAWGEKPVTSDPTQRLLTALGRFQRQFLKAREGAQQDQWSDECMNHLIQGVEIALEQGWTDIVEALGETGRVLQTYEDAGCANLCVPYLADSYETLCLMVGDLIVGKTRSGAMQKWRERYESALREVAAAGLTLVADDDGESPPRRPAEPRKVTSPPVLTVVPPSPPLQAPRQDTPITSEPEPAPPPPLPSPRGASGLTPLGELPPLKPVVVPEARFTPPPLPPQQTDTRGTLFDELSSADDDSVDIPELPEMGDEPLSLDLASFAEEEEAQPEPEPVMSEEEPEEVPPAARALAVDVVELLDTLCDGLARIENEPESSLSTVFLAMDDGLSTLEDRARQLGWHGSMRACRTMARLCEGMSNRRPAKDDKFFELAYAFGGVYGEAQSRMEDPALTTWQSECDALMEMWLHAPPQEVPAAAAIAAEAPELSDENANDLPTIEAEGGNEVVSEVQEPERAEQAATTHASTPVPEDDTAASLLDTARQAVAGGSIADAKFFAMRAAVSIAKKQVAETETRVRTLELRHQECARNIEVAREQVQQAEASVTEAERQVNEGTEAKSERGRHAEGVQTSLDGIQSRIDDLAERIRELQEQLEEAERQHAATQTALEEARAQETAASSRLEELKGNEQHARVQLEDARQQVKVHQRRLTEIEAAMEKSRELLTRQRASVAEIEQTIEQVRTAETSDAARADDLLF